MQELLEGGEEEVIDGAEVLAALVQAELEEDQLPLLHVPGPAHDQGGFLQRPQGQRLSPGAPPGARRLVLPARCSPPSGTQTLWGQPGALLTPAALKGTPATPSCSGSPSCGIRAKFNLSWAGNAAEARY